MIRPLLIQGGYELVRTILMGEENIDKFDEHEYGVQWVVNIHTRTSARALEMGRTPLLIVEGTVGILTDIWRHEDVDHIHECSVYRLASLHAQAAPKNSATA